MTELGHHTVQDLYTVVTRGCKVMQMQSLEWQNSYSATAGGVATCPTRSEIKKFKLISPFPDVERRICFRALPNSRNILLLIMKPALRGRIAPCQKVASLSKMSRNSTIFMLPTTLISCLGSSASGVVNMSLCSEVPPVIFSVFVNETQTWSSFYFLENVCWLSHRDAKIVM